MGADLNRTASRPPALAPVEGALAAAFRDVDHPTIGEAQIQWYAERLPRDRGPVLITMAGSAQLLIALAEQGFRVHGIDELASTVERCAATVADRGLDAPLFRQSLATLNLPFRYAAAIVAGESIQALDGRHRAVAALDRLRAHLVAPAMLLIEFSLPHAALHPTGAPAVEFSSIALADGSHILRRREISADAEARRIVANSRFERRVAARIVEREDAHSTLNCYDADAATALVLEAGFTDVERNASPSERHDNFVLIARA